MARRKSRKIGAINLAGVLSEVLKGYSDEVAAAIAPSVEDVAKDTVQTLKTTGDYEDITGDYRDGFNYATEKTYRRTTGTVYNEDYRRPHLLERPHLTRDGTTRTRAFPHWKPAEEKAIKDFEDNLRKNIEKAGG